MWLKCRWLIPRVLDVGELHVTHTLLHCHSINSTMSITQLASPALTSPWYPFALGDNIADPIISNAACTLDTSLQPTSPPGSTPIRSLDYITVSDSFHNRNTVAQPHSVSLSNAVCPLTTPESSQSSPDRSPKSLPSSDVPHSEVAPQTKYVTIYVAFCKPSPPGFDHLYSAFLIAFH